MNFSEIKGRNYIFDRGNSFTKWAVYRKNELINASYFPNSQSVDFFRNFEPIEADGNVIYATVSGPIAGLDLVLGKENITLAFNSMVPLPIKNNYQTPETLGPDRLASAVAAASLFPNEASLVIDIGTCLTFETITTNASYIGGCISPGLRMRFRALNRFTEKLPIIEPEVPESYFGNTTVSAINHGVVLGMIGEINYHILHNTKEFGKINVLVTGGDAPFFKNHIATPFMHLPNLVLDGLNTVLNYNLTLL